MKREKSMKEFQEKYIVMDKALSQVVYDALNSRRREAINLHSVNGIKQASVEKFCSNNYKIFSFLMQGDIFSKVWHYKDRLGNVQGPFMSFDMDIWNGEGNYFAKDLLISPDKKTYEPLHKYLDRESVILDLMSETIDRINKKVDPLFMPMMMPNPNMHLGMFQPPFIPGGLPMMKIPPHLRMKGDRGGKKGRGMMISPAQLQQMRAMQQMAAASQMHRKNSQGGHHQMNSLFPKSYSRKGHQGQSMHMPPNHQ